ncbi:replication protein [Aquimarina sp. 2201CG14-23]|uniref:replication protein n=1 Tax=Aquimarina mycalae TaxID=3040073 RepID=UPI002478006C|nr:replication protein [Aquimarina sp. 2201CG14-23]MDH7448450.1 replication protein [Aquimarina sp. 2201CG14-23]
MHYKQTTQVPNELFDDQLAKLTFSELKILMCVIRQTYGWTQKNGKRKTRDRITYNQFHKKTGVSLRSIPDAIQSLIIKQLIRVTDYHGELLHYPNQRKGKTRIYYAPCFKRCAKNTQKVCKKRHQPMQNKAYNKTNGTKLTLQKRNSPNRRLTDSERLQEILSYQK